MEFRDLIAQLRNDSKSYHFCRDGLKGVATAASVLQCVAMLRENIVYCFDSDYHQAVADNIEEWYQNWKKEFNQCGIWVNESSMDSKGIVIITDFESIHNPSGAEIAEHAFVILGKERCFIFGEKNLRVWVYDHAKLYSKNPNADIHLNMYSHGFIKNSKVLASGSAICYAEDANVMMNQKCTCYLTASCSYGFYSATPKVKTLKHLGFQ